MRRMLYECDERRFDDEGERQADNGAEIGLRSCEKQDESGGEPEISYSEKQESADGEDGGGEDALARGDGETRRSHAGEKRHGGPQGCVHLARFSWQDRENHAHDEDARKKERARVHGNSQARESVRKAGRMSCERAPRQVHGKADSGEKCAKAGILERCEHFPSPGLYNEVRRRTSSMRAVFDMFNIVR